MHPSAAPCRHVESGHFRHRTAWTTRRGAPGDLLVVWTVRGGMHVSVGGWSGAAGPGDLVVFPEAVAHRYRPASETGWEWWWLHVDGPGTRPVGDLLTRDGPRVRLGEDARLQARFSELVTAAAAAGRAPSDGARLHLDTCAASVLGLIAARAAGGTRPSTGPHVDLAGFVAWVDDHLGDPVTLADLARGAGWSPATLHRLARRHLGNSPMGYLTRRRMQEATRLLTGTDLAVQEIARRVGFPDPLHFSRRYRRLHGRPPSALRRPAPSGGGAGDDR